MFLVVVFDLLMANSIVAFIVLSVCNLSIRLLSGHLYCRTALAADIKALEAFHMKCQRQLLQIR